MAVILLDPEDFSDESSDFTVLSYQDWIDLREKSSPLLEANSRIIIKDPYSCFVIEQSPPENTIIKRIGFSEILSDQFEDVPSWADELSDKKHLISLLTCQPKNEDESFVAWLYRAITGKHLHRDRAFRNIYFAESVYLLFKSLMAGKCSRSWVISLLKNLFSVKNELIKSLFELSNEGMEKIPERLWLLPFRKDATQDELDFRRFFFRFLLEDDKLKEQVAIDLRKTHSTLKKLSKEVSDETSVRRILDLYTGYHRKEELEVIVKALALQYIGKSSPDQSLCEQLEATLSSIWDDLSDKLREVSRSDLRTFQDSDKWFSDYFCLYRRERLIRSVKNLSEFSHGFSEYVAKRNSSIGKNQLRSLLKVQSSIKSYLSEGAKVLVYVIDSCGGEWFGFLGRRFYRTGKVVDSDLLFADVPTTTETNRTSIIGKPLGSNESLETIMARTFDTSRAKYANSENCSLGELLTTNADLSIFWDLSLDRKIHSKSSGEFFDYFEEIEIVSEVSSKILDACKWFDGVIIVLSDHGNTVFSGDTVSYSQGEVEHGGRILRTKESSLFQSDDFIVVEFPDNNDDSKCVVSKGYDYFSSPRSRSVHGGASPEEVMIPFFIIDNRFSIDYDEPELVVSCDDTPLRKKGVDLELKIDNLSSGKLLIKRIVGRRVLEGPEGVSIPQKKSAKVFVKLDLYDVEISEVKIEVSITLIYNNCSFLKEESFMLSTKGAITRSSFDDNFEF